MKHRNKLRLDVRVIPEVKRALEQYKIKNGVDMGDQIETLIIKRDKIKKNLVK